MRSLQRPHGRSEAMLLAAIHTWAVAGSPRLARLLPGRAREGDPVILEGERLAGDDLRAEFGAISTWAVPLSDRAALVLVPAGAVAGPVTVQRQGLRSNSLAFGGPPDDGSPWVVRVDPWDGAAGVFRDAPVVVRFSHPADPASLSAETFGIRDPEGPVPGHLRFSPDGHVVIWRADGLLTPGVLHFVVAAGLRDLRGREVTPHLSRFVTCDMVRHDVPG